MDSLRIELRLHHTQALTASNRAKQSEIEVELFKEKEAAWRAEKQMLKLAAATSVPPHGRDTTDEIKIRVDRANINPRTRSYSPPVERTIAPSWKPATAIGTASSKYLDDVMVRQAAALDREVVHDNLNFLATKSALDSHLKDSSSTAQSFDGTRGFSTSAAASHVPNNPKPWVGAGIRPLHKLAPTVSSVDIDSSDKVPGTLEGSMSVGSSSSFVGFLNRVRKSDDDVPDAVNRQLREAPSEMASGLKPSSHDDASVALDVGDKAASAARTGAGTYNVKMRFNKLQDMYSRVLGKSKDREDDESM